MNFVFAIVHHRLRHALASYLHGASWPELIGVPPLTYALIAAGLAIHLPFSPILTNAIPSLARAIAVLTAAPGVWLELRRVGDLGELPLGAADPRAAAGAADVSRRQITSPTRCSRSCRPASNPC